MSVIVKGMQMPKECRWCPFAKTYDRKIICLATGKLLVEGATPLKPRYVEKFCSLVELPKKHGRLIDADAFAEHLQESAEELGKFAPQMATALEAAIRDLKDPKKTPTIVEAEGEEGEI